MNESDIEGRAAAVLELKKTMRRGPSGNLLAKHVKLERGRMRKTDYGDTVRRLAAQLVDGLAKTSIKPVALLAALARGARAGVGDCSTAAIRKIHARGLQLETPDQNWLRKLSAPPQSSNSRSDGVTADTGARLHSCPHRSCPATPHTQEGAPWPPAPKPARSPARRTRTTT